MVRHCSRILWVAGCESNVRRPHRSICRVRADVASGEARAVVRESPIPFAPGVARNARRNRVGRLAFSFRDRVDIEPLHYVFRGGWLYGRPSPGSKLQTLRHNPWVAFEVDEIDGCLTGGASSCTVRCTCSLPRLRARRRRPGIAASRCCAALFPTPAARPTGGIPFGRLSHSRRRNDGAVGRLHRSARAAQAPVSRAQGRHRRQ